MGWITDIIKGNKVTFAYYRQGYFYMDITYSGINYRFPVPREDLGDATVKATDKAIYYMRYIRKAMDDGTFLEVYE